MSDKTYGNILSTPNGPTDAFGQKLGGKPDTRIAKRLHAAKDMRDTANYIRTRDIRMVSICSIESLLAKICEAIAVLLEELP